MASSYIDQIDDQLEVLRAEIERLQIARDVIVNLEGRGKPVLTLRANPAPSQKSGPITIRKITDGPDNKEKKARPKIDRSRGKKALVRVKEILREHPDGLTSADINQLMGHQLGNKREYQLVWNVVSDGVKTGVFTRDDATRVYRLAPEAADDQSQ